MERELLLTVKKGYYNRQKMQDEMVTVQKLLPSIESFDTFLRLNDVFDMQGYTIIRHSGILADIYHRGGEATTRYRVIGKN